MSKIIAYRGFEFKIDVESDNNQTVLSVGARAIKPILKQDQYTTLAIAKVENENKDQQSLVI